MLNKRVSGEHLKGSRNAKLSHFVRLVVYSYLPFDDLFYKVGLLSSHERRSLQDSSIVRVNKEFKIKLTG